MNISDKEREIPLNNDLESAMEVGIDAQGNLFEITTKDNSGINLGHYSDGAVEVEISNDGSLHEIHSGDNREVTLSSRIGVRPPAHTWEAHGEADNAKFYFTHRLWNNLFSKRGVSPEQKFYIIGLELEDEKSVVFPRILEETRGSSVAVTSQSRYESLIEALTRFDPRIAVIFGHTHPVSGFSFGDVETMRRVSNYHKAFKNFIVVDPYRINACRMSPGHSPDRVDLFATSYLKFVSNDNARWVNNIRTILNASIEYAWPKSR